MLNVAVILLSGSGVRFGLTLPKQFIELNGSPLFSYSFNSFNCNKLIDEIILVTQPNFIDEVNNFLFGSGKQYTKSVKVIEGGTTRQQSSFLGISAISVKNCKVLIHDAVRPFIKQSIINECILMLDSFKAVSTVIPLSDTLYIRNDHNTITDIPLRESYVRAQTPQGFHIETILTAHKLAIQDGFNNAPDDCYLVKKYNLTDIRLVDGDINNIKVTYPCDIDIAEKLFDKYYEK